MSIYPILLPSPLTPPPQQGFAAAPSFGKEPAPPVAIWKGHSFNTISGREAEKFSGKDSGKGDSDFNDSDSDISGDALKKDLITHMQNGKESAPAPSCPDRQTDGGCMEGPVRVLRIAGGWWGGEPDASLQSCLTQTACLFPAGC